MRTLVRSGDGAIDVAATTDIISGGRVQMGTGGGWYEHEWRAYGYGFPDAAERLGHDVPIDEAVAALHDGRLADACGTLRAAARG